MPGTATDDFVPIMEQDGNYAGWIRSADIERLLLERQDLHGYETWRVQGWLRRTTQPVYPPQEKIDWVYLSGALPGRDSAHATAKLLALQIASPSIHLDWTFPDAADSATAKAV